MSRDNLGEQIDGWRILRALAPLLVLSGAAVAVSALFGHWLDQGLATVLPHLVVVLSMLALLYGLAALLPALGLGGRSTRWLVGGMAGIFTVALVIFYVASIASFLFMKELPTRQLVAGYVKDLPALLGALPVDQVTMTTLLLIVLCAAFGVGAFIAWCLATSVVEVRRAFGSTVGKVAGRIAVYGGAVHLLAAFSMPLGWHAFNTEIITSSWHNARLTKSERYGFRDPLYDATEQKIRASYPRESSGRRRNVILIYVDALRADATQPYGAERQNMPFVSSLVAAGKLAQADLALAACPSTICGLGALLQSRSLPLQHTSNFSLPQLLSLQGYRTAYVLSSNHQDFMELRNFYRPIDFYVDGKDLNPSRHADDYLVLDGLQRMGPWDGRPTFLMIGLVSTHLSGIRAKQNRVYVPDRMSLLAGADDYRTAYRNNYDNGVLQADDVIRQAWTWLDASGYLKDAIVVITSDHGEFLGERGRFSHGQTLYQSELSVPLWIRNGDAAIDRIPFARQIDIAPTIVAVLGLPVPPSWDGGTLLDARDPVRWSDHFLPSSRDAIAVVRHDVGSTIKLHWNRTTGTEEAFDLRSDPGEARDIVAQLPAPLIAEMRQRARASLQRP